MMVNFPGFTPRPWRYVGTVLQSALGSGSTEQWALAREMVSPARVRWAMRSFKSGKIAGLNGVSSTFLIGRADEPVRPFLHIARASRALGFIPGC